MMREKINQLSKSFHEEIVEVRRHLHRYPELSYQEVETGKFICKKLTEYGVEHKDGWGENGVVALIKGHNPEKKVVALRADIDALPIQEANDISYRSAHEGKMHACGHDVHTASLLGVAKILHELRSEFEGTVKLIFQPAEEKLPGGASILIKEGVLLNPSPEGIFGQHVHPPLEVGKVGFRPGMYMASADEIFLTVKGKGGHGALPQECIDPIVIASQIVIALQQIVSRKANPTIPSVLTFGKINTVGGANNIIPNEVKLEGTFRTMNEEWRSEAHVHMTTIVEGIARSFGATVDFRITKGYPFLVNDEPLTHRAFQWAKEYLGDENVVELPIRMTAEDFSYYSQEMPACFYRLGTGNKAKGIISPVHTDTFDVDEKSLEIGMGLMSYLAIQELKIK